VKSEISKEIHHFSKEMTKIHHFSFFLQIRKVILSETSLSLLATRKIRYRADKS
jgi:hypothetical protein